MGVFGQIITILCAALPAWVVAVLFSILAIFAIIVAIKVVAFVLKAIPFL